MTDRDPERDSDPDAAPEPVYDFLPGVPPVTDEAIESAVSAVRADGVDAAAWDAHLDERVRRIRSDPGLRERVERSFRDAGVTLVSPTVMSTDPRLSFVEGVYRDLARWQARFETFDWLERVTSPERARRAVAAGKVGVVLNTQNLGGFTRGDRQGVDVLFNAGVRSMQLTYNRQNEVGAGCIEPSGSGLSTHGRAVVDRLNDLGAVVDLSHCGKQTTLDAIERSEDPVAVTHAHCGALVDSPRATSDEELRALADADGYMGVLVYPTLYDDPTFETVCEHLDHAVSILGPDGVGVATDWGMTTPDVPDSMRPGLLAFWREQTGMTENSDHDPLTMSMFEGSVGRFETYDDRPAIREEFEKRGYDEDEVAGFLGRNFLSFWERVAG